MSPPRSFFSAKAQIFTSRCWIWRLPAHGAPTARWRGQASLGRWRGRAREGACASPGRWPGSSRRLAGASSSSLAMTAPPNHLAGCQQMGSGDEGERGVALGSCRQKGPEEGADNRRV